MRFQVRCYFCTHGDFECDELREGARCAHCGVGPTSYVVDGKEFCWLHRYPLGGAYLISALSTFTVYEWRGRPQAGLPHARLFEASCGQPISRTSSYCPVCQEAYERWQAEDDTGRVAAEG
jgi:hypothetical protein